MKQGMAIVGVLIAAALIAACGGTGKYADVKALFAEQIKVANEFNAALDKSTTTEQALKAVETYSAAVKNFNAMMDEMRKTYPELGKATEPAELKSEIEQMNKAEEEMLKIVTKKSGLFTDAKAKKALQDLLK